MNAGHLEGARTIWSCAVETRKSNLAVTSVRSAACSVEGEAMSTVTPAKLFEGAGYAALTPGWQDDPDTVQKAREHPEFTRMTACCLPGFGC